MAAQDLPDAVRRYVERNVGRDDKVPLRVRLSQVGEMQLKPGRWLPFEASQEISVERVELTWRARFRVVPLVSLGVVDWYRDGEGGLEGRLCGVIPIVRGRGPGFAKGEAMRYLAELPWAPHAIRANRNLEWRELEADAVEVATNVGSERPAVRLYFDATGDVTRASADARPRMVGKRVVDTPFAGRFGNYEVAGGIRVPTTAEVSWELSEGPFTYFRGRLTGLQVDSLR
jgi:hypothetical protein